MAGPLVLIFHRPARADDAPLVRLLAATRGELIARQSKTFAAAGAGEVHVSDERRPSFGELLADNAPANGGLVVFSSGAVPRLARRDAERLVAVAESGAPVALTNNRYSSDICAIGDARILRSLPALPSDNSLPRWLEERAGFDVRQLPGRDRLALDIDSPLDIALWTLTPDAPRWLRSLADTNGIAIPRVGDLRELAADSRRELLVFGRGGSATLRWLERNVRCRVRFLAEERGLRASSPLAIGGTEDANRHRVPRATLGRLLDHWGPEALASVVGELGDGAIIDTRVLMADRFGPDETAWPSPADRYASDLLRSDEVKDPWLRALTESAAKSDLPIALGAHSLVGPGIPLLFRVLA
jgi:CTP:molybdopterin cytidylyltransferase MocA